MKTKSIIGCAVGLILAGILTAGQTLGAGIKLQPVKDYIPEDAQVVERRGICLSTDESILYLAGLQDRTLYSFDTKTGTMLNSASMSDYVADAYGKAVAVGPDGDVWAPTSSTLELLRYSKTLDYKGTYSISDLGAEVVEGLAVDKEGRLYIPDRKNAGGIYRATVGADFANLDTSFGKGGHAAPCGEVRQIAVGYDGSIYVGDFSGTTIYKVDGKSGKETVLTSKVEKPYHLAVDKAGTVYIAQYDAPTALTIVAADGSIIASFTAAELGINDRSAGVAVNAAGTRLFVVDQKDADYGGIAKEFALVY